MIVSATIPTHTSDRTSVVPNTSHSPTLMLRRTVQQEKRKVRLKIALFGVVLLIAITTGATSPSIAATGIGGTTAESFPYILSAAMSAIVVSVTALFHLAKKLGRLEAKERAWDQAVSEVQQQTIAQTRLETQMETVVKNTLDMATALQKLAQDQAAFKAVQDQMGKFDV